MRGEIGIVPSGIIFDWDNTLVDSWSVIGDALNATFRDLDYPEWTPAEVKAKVRHSLRDSFPRMFGPRWEEARGLYLKHFEEVHIARLKVLDGAAELVEALHRTGIYLAIVSNKTGRLLRAEVAALGWNPYFSAIIGAGDAPADKPDPAPVAQALAPGGIVPSSGIWFVGDTDIDVICAHNASCTAVLVGSEPVAPEIQAMGPILTFLNCRTLLDAILPSRSCNTNSL
ncbi:MAG TPA: HAD family hydrolase [Stellaceae bacterium]|jgi:phosphoglycolate phosphatase|nr:HAD family hydrolase [Stellaceae bacterium]